MPVDSPSPDEYTIRIERAGRVVLDAILTPEEYEQIRQFILRTVKAEGSIVQLNGTQGV
jgi:hypothetical protein